MIENSRIIDLKSWSSVLCCQLHVALKNMMNLQFRIGANGLYFFICWLHGFHWQADIEKLRHAVHALSAYLLNFNMTLPEKCLNTEFFFCSECGKIRARTNSVFGHFSRSVINWKKYPFYEFINKHPFY